MPKAKGMNNFAVADNGCHEHNGRANVRGYPYLTYKKKNWYGNRLAWHLKRGPIPEGMHVLHKCDNPKCINIDHLFLGTPKDNAKDMRVKGREGYGTGEAHSQCILSWEDVKRIREAALFGAKNRDMADAYGVHISTVWHIVSGNTRRMW